MEERKLLAPNPPLSSRGFRLRPFKVRDADAIKAAGSDPDIIRHTFMPARPSDEVVQRWLTQAIQGWEHGMARFAVVSASGDDDRCMGQVGLILAKHPEGNAEALYWLLPEARGVGWAADALRIVCDWAFASLAVERVAALVDLDNISSQRTAERAGFTREGVLRGYQRVPRLGRIDLLSFSRLASD